MKLGEKLAGECESNSKRSPLNTTTSSEEESNLCDASDDCENYNEEKDHVKFGETTSYVDSVKRKFTEENLNKALEEINAGEMGTFAVWNIRFVLLNF